MAISFVRVNQNATGTGTVAVTMGGAVAVGDLLVAAIGSNGTNVNATPTISDTVNVGAWQKPAAANYFTSQGSGGFFIQNIICYIVCDTAGTPTLTFSGLGANTWNVDVAQYTGFTNTPTFKTADVTQNQGTSASPSATTLVNSVFPELCIVHANCAGGQNFTAATGSFTGRDGFGSGTANIAFGDVIETTSGNSISYGATISSNNWAVQIVGFQDAVAVIKPPVGAFGNYGIQPFLAS